MRKTIRVLLIENQTLTRIGIETILGGENDIEIIGEADTSAKGFELFKNEQPDVTILSLRLPDACAIDRLEAYFGENKHTKLIVLADTAGDAEISKALKKGALGYVCKDVAPDELIKAVRVVSAGRRYIPTGIAEILSENLGQEELTPAEQKVLQRIVKGESNREIARFLGVSENTVKTHVANILGKLGVSDRTSAATLAIKRGFVRMES